MTVAHDTPVFRRVGAAIGLQTTAESSYPAGLTPHGVAVHTQTEGWGDRKYICDVLRWVRGAEDSHGFEGGGGGGGQRWAQQRAKEWQALQAAETAAAAAKIQVWIPINPN
eukprot:SAG31_NODE_5591_length_2437_cov_1.515398_4_plen_111_part_00